MRAPAKSRGPMTDSGKQSKSGVMAGLVPAIPIGKTLRIRNRDARAKPAHDATMDCFVAPLGLLAMTGEVS
jgi:hypothetical protein